MPLCQLSQQLPDPSFDHDCILLLLSLLNTCFHFSPFQVTHPGHWSIFRKHSCISPTLHLLHNLLHFLPPPPLLLFFVLIVHIFAVPPHSIPLPLTAPLHLLLLLPHHLSANWLECRTPPPQVLESGRFHDQPSKI